MTTKAIHYTVKGSYPFPVGMLRRDQSRAAAPRDQVLINRLSAEHAPDREALSTEVEIHLVGPNKPNCQRWESFGWSVPSDREYALQKEIEDNAQEDERLFQSALGKLTDDERRVVLARAQHHN